MRSTAGGALPSIGRRPPVVADEPVKGAAHFQQHRWDQCRPDQYVKPKQGMQPQQGDAFGAKQKEQHGSCHGRQSSIRLDAFVALHPPGRTCRRSAPPALEALTLYLKKASLTPPLQGLSDQPFPARSSRTGALPGRSTSKKSRAFQRGEVTVS